MRTPPDKLGEASVLCYTPIDERYRHTGNCLQMVGGVTMGPVPGLAICQYEGDDAFYLFGCDVE